MTAQRSTQRSRPSLFIKPPKSIMRKVGRAIVEFNMIREGDRVLLGVSGGKDSLSLLHILGHLKTYSPVTFDLGIVTVDPQVDGFEPSTLASYYNSLNIPYYYKTENIIDKAKSSMQGDSFCSFCSRIKRGLIYRTCREQGYNVLALAQHLDDLAESLLMTLFHGGQLRTMKAHYRNDAGDIRVIRPLVYCRERQMADFSRVAQLPIVADSCPACFSKPTERERMKQLLGEEERLNKHVFSSLKSAMKGLLYTGDV
jgi:tRNA 2-thiocytidine biosynthesis protein TtcA